MAVKSRRARLWQRWMQAWRQFPALRLIALLVALLLLQSVLFWRCERGYNPEITNPLEALWAITVFVFSGADFTPVTGWGRFLALVGIVEGMTLVSVLIASLTVLQLRGWKGGTRKMRGHIIVDEIVCLDQFSEYLILQSLVSPGLSRMFRSLLEFGEGDEVYRISVPSAYIGWMFRELFLDLYQKRSIILLAVERGQETVVNPKGEFRLREGDALFLVAPEEPSFAFEEA